MRRLITCGCGNEVATNKPKSKMRREQPQCSSCGARLDG